MKLVTRIVKARNLKPGDLIVRAMQEREIQLVKKNGTTVDVEYVNGDVDSYQATDNVTRQRWTPER